MRNWVLSALVLAVTACASEINTANELDEQLR